MNPNDKIRDKILRYLYDVHRKARGPKGVAVGIRDLHRDMRADGIKQADANSNLDYLIQKGWVREVVEPRTFRTPRGTTQQAERRTYKISDIGIDKLEAASIYRREEALARINVTTISGVTVIGEGNVVNTQMADLSRMLSELAEVVQKTTTMSEKEKLDVLADVATIQSQLAKPEPSRSLIRSVWVGIEKIVTAAGLAEVASKVAELIGHLPH